MTEHNNPQDNVTVPRELLRQVLKTLTDVWGGYELQHQITDSITALRTALEQPAVEPDEACPYCNKNGSNNCANAADEIRMYGGTPGSGHCSNYQVYGKRVAPQAQQPAAEQQLMRLLASEWFYGGWKAESRNERDMEALMVAAGWWPIKDEDALFARIEAPQAQPAVEPVAYWVPKAEQFCMAPKKGRPFAKAWEPLYAAPQAQEKS